MKKLLLLISLTFLIVLWSFVSCDTATTPLVTSERTEATAESSEEVTSEENTAETEETTEADTTEEETTAEVITEEETSVKELYSHSWTYTNADFFDYQLTHIPDDEDFEKIQEGMTIAEVIEIVGRPHGTTKDNWQRLYWHSTGNNRYFISHIPPLDENGKVFRNYSIFDYYGSSTLYKYEKRKQLNELTKPVLEGLYALVEDPRYKTLPSYEDIINLPVGMTFQEIMTLYGKPQYYGYFTVPEIGTLLFWVFYTTDGIEVGVTFDRPTVNSPWEEGRVSYVIALDRQNYIPETNTPETTTAAP